MLPPCLSGCRMLLEAYSRFRAVHKKMQWLGQSPQMLVLEEKPQEGAEPLQAGAERATQLAMRAQGTPLPHPPRVCRRHMAALRRDTGTRVAIANLCALMARRYERWQAWARAKYQHQQQQQQEQEKQQQQQEEREKQQDEAGREGQGTGDSGALVPEPSESDGVPQGAEPGTALMRLPEGGARAGAEEGGAKGRKRPRRGRGEVEWESGTPWDDFSEPSVRAALDRVLHAHYSIRPWLARRRFSGRQLSTSCGPRQPLSAGAPPRQSRPQPQGLAGGSGRGRGPRVRGNHQGSRGEAQAEGTGEEAGAGGVDVAVSCAAELLQAVILNTSAGGTTRRPWCSACGGFRKTKSWRPFAF